MQTSPEYEKRKMTNLIRTWVSVCCIFVISLGYIRRPRSIDIFQRYFSEENLKTAQQTCDVTTIVCQRAAAISRNISRKSIFYFIAKYANGVWSVWQEKSNNYVPISREITKIMLLYTISLEFLFQTVTLSPINILASPVMPKVVTSLTSTFNNNYNMYVLPGI